MALSITAVFHKLSNPAIMTHLFSKNLSWGSLFLDQYFKMGSSKYKAEILITPTLRSVPAVFIRNTWNLSIKQLTACVVHKEQQETEFFGEGDRKSIYVFLTPERSNISRQD
jgi:hypothetical protein